MGVLALPVLLGHLPAVGPQPHDVGQARRPLVADEEVAPAEDRLAAAQRDHLADEGLQLLVDAVPVEPGQLGVLTPGVVVALLAAAELVAAEQHRHALGEQQRGQEVALLAGPQRVDLRIVGVALDAAVPGAVVVGAVLVVLQVGLVVLLVVGDQVSAA